MTDDAAILVRISDVLFDVSETDRAALNSAERTFLLVWELEADVNNGGFSQYFFNSAGDRARDVPTALRAIRAENTAAIVEQALETFDGRFSEERDARQAILEEIAPDSEHFEALDKEFFACRDDLSALLSAFVAEHRSAIRGAR
jgi:hypothetical protein